MKAKDIWLEEGDLHIVDINGIHSIYTDVHVIEERRSYNQTAKEVIRETPLVVYVNGTTMSFEPKEKQEDRQRDRRKLL